MGSHRTGGRWPLAVAVAAYVVLAAVALSLVVWSNLTSSQHAVMSGAVSNQAPLLVVGVALSVAGLVALVARLLGRYTKTTRRLTAETRLLLDANPDHLVDRSGPHEFAELAAAVDDLAERRRVAEHEVATQIGAAQAGLEQERNRLATLMAELAVAVLVCNVDGRILLYNAAARSVLDDDTVVGLGRSIFGIVDRDLLEHAVARIHSASTSSHVATTLHGGRLLQVQVATVHGPEREITGFVLLLEDLTERIRASGRRDDLLREFTEATRASLGSIQAAIETVMDYPEMEAEERAQFVAIVREESQRLGSQVEVWAAESAAYLAADWLLSEVSGNDLLTVVADAIEPVDDMTVTVRPTTDALWVKAQSHALARSAAHLFGRLHEQLGVEAVTLAITRAGGHAQMEVTWTGQAPEPEDFQAWLDQPLTGGGAPNVREVVARHGGEVWAGGTSGDEPHVRLLLPLTEAATPPERSMIHVASRPEFYDFGLFDRQEESRAWHDRSLGDLEYTVFDTETTGLQPTQGDEIISLGAVRVVNGRLLRQESFERLVDPQRRVPAVSTAVHGLTREMLTGQPTLETVLPEFARYAADTVLVGHNVGFDMQFLRLKEALTGVRFSQPVLDTLLLDAAIHPDHDEHSLEAIASRLGIDVVGRHTALGDALVTGEVFLRLITLLQQRGAQTLGEVVEASRATMQARIDRSMYSS
ncbi:MAG TPA: exonuclease domain-containing protein [Nocardioidaceae bacterium]|nr:exonuclease domain-containing protein [Nocardioidaceae bacterium]